MLECSLNGWISKFNFKSQNFLPFGHDQLLYLVHDKPCQLVRTQIPGLLCQRVEDWEARDALGVVWGGGGGEQLMHQVSEKGKKSWRLQCISLRMEGQKSNRESKQVAMSSVNFSVHNAALETRKHSSQCISVTFSFYVLLFLRNRKLNEIIFFLTGNLTFW